MQKNSHHGAIIKETELLLRRLIMRTLKLIVHRKNPGDDAMDFNKCKFLFFRQDKIGDALISTPVFFLIKKKYPGAVIDLLLSPHNHAAIENDPAIRRRWIYKKNFSAVLGLLFAVRRERYDVAVDMMDNASTTATLLCLLTGARLTVGLEKENSYCYDIVVPRPSQKDTHIVVRTAQLLHALRIDPAASDLRLHYTVKPESEDFAHDFLARNQLHSRKLVGINISAGGTTRFWGIENFRNLIAMFRDKYPELRVIVLFKPVDSLAAHSIAADYDNTVLSPMTSTFDQFAALIKKVSLLVSPDTSAVHLASAFAVPAVVLYIQSNKEIGIWSPYGVEHEALVTSIGDLSAIPFEDVGNACKRLLGRIAEANRSA
jgi:ADP-heptose:LPS heptosyltransferase